MFYTLKRAKFLLEGTPPDLQNTGPRLRINAPVEDDPPEGKSELLSPDGKHRKIKHRTPAGTVLRGWIDKTLLDPADAPERPQIIMWAFLTTCVRAEEWINNLKSTGSNPVNADYLIALASYESGIGNVGKKTSGTDAVGPFQITSQRWSQFTSGNPDPDEKFVEDDRNNVSDQIYGAAFLTREDTLVISKAITQHDEAAGTNPDPKKAGPYIPTYSDVFIAALAGTKAAITLRQLQIDGKGNTFITKIVEGLDDGKKSEMERIFRHNHHLMKVDEAEAKAKGISAGPRTVKDLYDVVEAKLDDLLKQAFMLIKEHTPELLPSVAKETTSVADESSWLSTAVAELADPWKNGTLKETTPGGTARVLEYFKATDLSTSKVLPWCGAFVSHCLKQAGGDIAKSIVKGSARASNWKTWGNLAIPVGTKNIPAGAVVVLSPPPKSARSGHVAFASPNQSGKPGKITLLGGNQSDTVRDTDYARSKIVAVRWFGPPLEKPASGSEPVSIPSGPGIAWGKFVDKKHGSEKFKKKVIEVSGRINCDPNFLMAVMAFETGRKFTPNVRNKVSGATGLIQFMPTTAAELGTSTTELAKMTAVKQLDFVEKYMKRWARGRKFELLSDVYMAVLWPAAFGKSDSHALFSKPSKQYSQNSGLDIERNGNVTKGEATAKVHAQLVRGLKPENLG